MGEAAASGLRFFLDRGLGSRIVPEALRQAAMSAVEGWVLVVYQGERAR